MRKKIIFIYMIIFLHHHSTYSFWRWTGFLWSKHTKISPEDFDPLKQDFDPLKQEIDDMTEVEYIKRNISELKAAYNDIKIFETNYDKKKQLGIITEGKSINENELNFKITSVMSLLEYKYNNLKEQNEQYDKAIKIITKYHNKSKMRNPYTTHLRFLIALQTPVIESLEEARKSLEEEKQKAKMYGQQYNTQPDTELLTQGTIFQENQDNNKLYEFKEE